MADASARVEGARADALRQWQEQTLPFVRLGIAALAVVVFVSVLIGAALIFRHALIGSPYTAEMATEISANLSPDAATPFDGARAAAATSAYEVVRHYDQTGAALLTRELLRLAGFLIGAALCFVGSLFVLGKFSDVSPTTLTIQDGNANSSLSTASPGLFAMAIGAALVAAAIFAHYDVKVGDPPIAPAPPADSGAPPLAN